MKFFIDTANIDEIRKANDMGIIWPYEEIGGKDNVINSEKDENLQSFKTFLDRYEDFLR